MPVSEGMRSGGTITTYLERMLADSGFGIEAARNHANGVNQQSGDAVYGNHFGRPILLNRCPQGRYSTMSLEIS